jgi:CRISPR-associated protein Cmr4
MTSARALVYLHAASPLHVGTGQALDTIDLPIQRERATKLPVVSGSAVKGVLRAQCEALEAKGNLPAGFVDSAFGNEKRPSDGAGAVTFGDARLLLLPVRSVRLLFAWVTSPYLLRRYLRDRSVSAVDDASVVQAALQAAGSVRGTTAVCSNASLLVDAGGGTGTAYVEDADLHVAVREEIENLADQLAKSCLPGDIAGLLSERLLVVDDTVFGTFATQCTEVVARVALLDDRKTVRRGGLWYEEALPAETVLYAAVVAEKTRGTRNGAWSGTAEEHITRLRTISAAQFGGKASVGRGLCHVTWEAA